MNVIRASRFAFAVLALSFVAGAASAQEWPTAYEYKCRWSMEPTLGSITYGQAEVTFQNMVDVPGWVGIRKTGVLRTEYPTTGAVVNKNITLTWDWNSGDHVFFLQVSGGPDCTLTTYEGDDPGQAAVRFDGIGLSNTGPNGSCSNGAYQVCARYNQWVP